METPTFRTAGERSSKIIARGTVPLTLEDTTEWVVDENIQRPLTINAKVWDMARSIADRKAIPQPITIGIFKGKQYLLDGQHRIESFKLAIQHHNCPTSVTAEIRWEFFDNYAMMALRFDELQRHITKMKPDDGLRALEHSVPVLGYIKKACPFVGYGKIQRANATSASLSMSVLLRCWMGSAPEVPCSSSGAARDIVSTMVMDEAEACTAFARLAYRAWENNYEFGNLWGALNLTLCMWLYRRMVMEPEAETTRLNREQFQKFLTSLTHPDYVNFLRGKQMSSDNRNNVMRRLEGRLSAHLKSVEKIRRPRLPARDWEIA